MLIAMMTMMMAMLMMMMQMMTMMMMTMMMMVAQGQQQQANGQRVVDGGRQVRTHAHTRYTPTLRVACGRQEADTRTPNCRKACRVFSFCVARSCLSPEVRRERSSCPLTTGSRRGPLTAGSRRGPLTAARLALGRRRLGLSAIQRLVARFWGSERLE